MYAPVPSYQQVADDITRLITTGTYTRKLPGERDLAAAYDVSYGTVRRAMKVLRAEGLIVSIQGHGTFVATGKRSRHCPSET